MSKHDPVETAMRTPGVSEVFVAARDPLTPTKLAARLGFPVSSTHALIRAQLRRGHVDILDTPKRVSPTKRLLMMAQHIALNATALDRIAPVLTAIQAGTQETANLGDVKPLHSSATGEAMLGPLPESERAKLARVLPGITATTIRGPDAPLADLAADASRGFFTTRGANLPRVMAIAASRIVGDGPRAEAISAAYGSKIRSTENPAPKAAATGSPR